MRIFHVLNHFLPAQRAGTEVYTHALAKNLQQKNVEVEIVIPNYGKDFSSSYTYESINVFQYAEPSVVDRPLIMGFREPDGLKIFQEYISNKKPDIVHFHELAGSNGITLHHVLAAKASGAKVAMTFHLAGYTCRTGNLLYNEKEICDGKMRTIKCSKCYLNSKGYHLMKLPLIASSSLLHFAHINPTVWKNKLGTSIGTTFIIGQLKKNFLTLAETCDALVPIAKWYKEVLLLNGAPLQKIKLIKQGLPSAFKEQSKADFKKNNVIRLIFIGRVHPLKGIHLLIDALMDLPDDKIQLDIYGKRNDDGYTRDCIKKTGHKKNIRWKNELANEQVVETMQQYDALCLCSTFSEMSPLVIQEAFAAGIPVIASDVYGNAEQIQHKKNGLLFKFKDTASLKEQLLWCINNPQLLAEMKKNIEPPGSFAKVASEYYSLYQTLLSA